MKRTVLIHSLVAFMVPSQPAAAGRESLYLLPPRGCPRHSQRCQILKWAPQKAIVEIAQNFLRRAREEIAAHRTATESKAGRRKC
jgi:hypothetical protein